MEIRCDRLLKLLESTQVFLLDRAKNVPSLAELQLELQALTHQLQAKKLYGKILGCDETLMQALEQWFSRKPNWHNACQFQKMLFPDTLEAFSVSNSQHLRDCDVICAVFRSPQILTGAVTEILLGIHAASASKKILVVDVSDLANPAEESYAEIVQKIQDYVGAAAIAMTEIVPIQLVPSTRLVGGLEKKLEQFAKPLENALGRKPEDLLAQRIGRVWFGYIEQIEQVLTQEANLLDCQVQTLETKLAAEKQNNSNIHLRDQVNRAMQIIHQEREKFFKQLELELKNSKAELLDEFNRRSITYQIQLFVENLQPKIVRQYSTKYIQLQTDNTEGSIDINIDLMQLCYCHLSQWTIAEWQYIYTQYGEGGLNQFFERSYAHFQGLPVGNLLQSLAQSSISPAPPQQILKDYAAGVQCESHYKEMFIGNYLLRQIRNQWMGFTFLITFVTMIGITPNSNKRALIQGLFTPILQLKHQPVLLTAALALPLCTIFIFLFYNYQNDNQQKIEDTADKLKRKLMSHYQEFAKRNADKLLQHFLDFLKLQDERLQQGLAYIDEQIDMFSSAANRGQSFLEDSLKAVLAQKQLLDKAKSDLQKLKRG